MRILHVTPCFYPAWAYGGIARCSFELCRALARAGDEVSVWTTDVFDATQRIRQPTATVEGIDVRYFPNVSNRAAYHLQLYLPRGLRPWARRHVGEFDIVHLHSNRHLLNPWVVAAARAARVPYVFLGNGTVPRIERYQAAKRVVDVLGGRDILRRAASCIAVAHAEVEHYRAAGVDAENIRVIPNGLRLDDYDSLPPRGRFRSRHSLGEGPLVLFVGKITPRKGLDVLIRALARLPSGVRLAVAGNFMMPDQPIRRLARELDVHERVDFVGLLSGEEKLAAYVDADVVAYPSQHEIFGLVPVEALMCGTPVVVCDDSGCAEIVRAAGGGSLVPYGDHVALADALIDLLADPARRHAHVASGRRYVREHLGWDQIARDTRQLYDQILRP